MSEKEGATKTLDWKEMDNIAGLVQAIKLTVSKIEDDLDSGKMISASKKLNDISKKAEMIFLRTRP